MFEPLRLSPFALALVMLPGATLPLSADAQIEPVRPGQESFITQAVFADGRLWVLADSGKLNSVAPDGDRWAPETLPEPVHALCVLDGQIIAATGPRKDSTTWTLRRRSGSKWDVFAAVSTRSDYLIALSCAQGRITLLTQRRLITVTGDRQASATLTEPIRGGVMSATYATGGSLYLGIDAGEWGGGLKRIDRLTGRVTTLARNAEGGLCDGPLNTACDPVNAIVPEPWKPDCLLVSVGLVHMVSHGRLVEVCGSRIERLYFKPCDSGFPDRSGKKRNEPFSTVAFYSATVRDGAAWIAGLDGLYRMTGPDKVTMQAYPPFRAIGGVRVSFGHPDFILVRTDVNARVSLGGGAPMIVSR
ncbi:MAG: hypothetical protein ABI810_12215 [Sphingomonas bacterium]